MVLTENGKSRNKLIETATELFMSYGVKRVTVQEICSDASLSKMTFYKYFRNKEDLVGVIRRSLIEKGFDEFDQIEKRDIPFPDKIDLMSRWRLEFFNRFNREFLEEVLMIEDLDNRFKEKFILNLKKAQERGEIRESVSMDLVWLVVEKMRELTKEGLWRELFDDYGTYQDQMRMIFFRGILS